jgi:tetratricopeptide (TPR) repeat protein
MDRAEECWRRAVELNPTNADALLGLGRLALNRNQAAVAVTWLERAADASPQALDPLYNLSRAYRLLGRIDDALRCEALAAKARAGRGGAGDTRESPRGLEGLAR